MRHLGVLDAEVTRYSGDGGIDVESADFAAQVKNYSRTVVGVEEVRAFFGASTACRKLPILFTSGKLSASARDFAEMVGMAVIQYDAVSGSARGANDLGGRAVDYGVREAFERRCMRA